MQRCLRFSFQHRFCPSASPILHRDRSPAWRIVALVTLGFVFTLSSAVHAQDEAGSDESPAATLSPTDGTEFMPILEGLQYRSIGPYRGGRSAACAGVPGKPMLYYFGAAGGGVWKTEDGGSNWTNISDGYFGGSIGSVAVAPSNANILYVGGGEVTIRGNVSHGNGMWKSIDGGKTWKHIGLEDSHCIPRLQIDPENPDIVYAAVLGHLYGPNQQRGVFKSTDGGESWKRVLFVSDEAGAVDLAMDPSNSRTLYASTWKVSRTPYSLESGGEGSGLWKSEDAGETWTEISRNSGLPKGTLGIIGVDVSPVNTDRIWAIIEAEDGGVFRSDNGGESWRKVNDERKLRQRAWYYTRIYASTQDADEVYVVNVGFHRSTDGGETYSSIRTPHGDHHDLWIAPEDSERMIVADDGGGQVTFDGGENWSTYYNQPTSQFYRVTTDNHVPYRIYGAQQDNSTVRIFHRTGTGRISESDWESTAGGESGHIAPDPTNPDIVYGGSYGGFLTRLDHSTGEVRNIHVWPDNPMGSGAGANKYRFQWNFPIFFSPHDSTTLYTAANVLFKTNDEGQSWQQISPDLTRNAPKRLGSSGGPITKDNTSVEYYCTIFAALESPHEAGVLWVGSDDGLVHLSQDGGESWNDVTPPELPEWTQINSLEPHPTEAGGLYLAATSYKSDDFKPYLYKTMDYGKSWELIVDGIDRKHFTRVVRADPGRAGLLYAGTESGMYVSFDDGASWKPFQLNLPIVPITDLAIRDDDLIVATQGRSFWMLDDLTILHQLDKENMEKSLHVFEPKPTIRFRGRSGRGSSNPSGQDLPFGASAFFYLEEALDDGEMASIEFKDSDGELITRYSTKPDRKKNERPLTVEPGLNRISWDMRYPPAESFDGLVMWSGSTRGPSAIPGEYTMTVKVSDVEESVTVDLQSDPRSAATQEDFELQLEFLLETRDKLSETHRAIKTIRDVRDQIQGFVARMPQSDSGEDDDDAAGPIKEKTKAIIQNLTDIEETLYQTKNRSSQDPLNFPIRLNDKLAGVASVAATGNFRPTAQARAVRAELIAKIDEQLEAYRKIISEDVPELNQMILESQIPTIVVEDE
ncbi:MAG: WD40/YVTN/BNR-like repeat-containing protein [Aureliella sp.]